MDNLTHTLIGVAAANAGLKQRWGRGVLLALVVASNITDLDILWGVVHQGNSFLYRRMMTHSVIGLPLLSAAGAFLFHLIYKNISWRVFFGLFLIGTSLHVFFDLLNSYGVVVFYPLSRVRYELGWVFIIDLVIWFLLLVPLAISVIPSGRVQVRRLSFISLICLSLYVALCGLSRWRAVSELAEWAQSQKEAVTFSYVFPEALGPHRFRGVARQGNFYRVFLINSIIGELKPMETMETEEDSPEVQLIKSTPEAKNIEWFFKAPVWRKMKEINEWEVFDLRFQSEVIARDNPFSYRFRVENGRVSFLD